MAKKNRVNETLVVAALQLDSGPDWPTNRAAIDGLVAGMAVAPDVLVLPEMFNVRHIGQAFHTESINGPCVRYLKQLAFQTGATIIGGSFAEATMHNKAYNTTVVVAPSGDIQATYRKLHLFDANLSQGTVNESAKFVAGNAPSMVSWGRQWHIGLSICYDLRFPELYRYYQSKGAHVLVVPSCFTRETGQKHWEVLLRARAIENQCYVVAPNQCGIGSQGVNTHGHSMVVSPSGEIMAQADGSSPCVIVATLSMADIQQVRGQLKRPVNILF
jgi:predicted amidohydrolase